MELMPSKWNPKIDCSGAWRLDVDIGYSTEKDNGGDVESLENESEKAHWIMVVTLMTVGIAV